MNIKGVHHMCPKGPQHHHADVMVHTFFSLKNFPPKSGPYSRDHLIFSSNISPNVLTFEMLNGISRGLLPNDYNGR